MDKAYRSYGTYLKGLLGCRTCKLTLDAGFSCPNRDGTKAWGGCIFCDPTGSSSRAQDGGESITDQLLHNLEKQRKRFKARKFIAYFQSFTNTYAPVAHLKALYDEACAAHEDIVGLAISTRPDCVDAEKLDLIASYRDRLPYVSIEYGLQTIHDRTLKRINRAETHADFLRAYEATRERSLDHCVHVVLDLPGESWDDQMATADRLAELRVNGVKIHLLCAMEGTVLARQYERGEWQPLDPEAYPALVCDFLERLHPECVIHRVAGNGHHEHIVAPSWLQRKQELIPRIDAEFARRGTRQGSRCRCPGP